jgi:acetyl esterase/lipase
MSRRDLIDPDARQPLDLLQQAIPGGFNTIPDIVQRRATVSGLLAAMEVPPNPNVTSEDRSVPGPDGAPDIKVRIYRPVDATGTLPGIYYIHGGGMILGDLDGEDAVAASICEHGGRLRRVPAGSRAPLPGAGRGLLRRPGLDGGPRR